MRPWAWGGPRRIDRPAEFGCKAQVTDNEDDEDDDEDEDEDEETLARTARGRAARPRRHLTKRGRLTRSRQARRHRRRDGHRRTASPDQYANPENPASHHDTTGPEIWAQTDGTVTHFVAGIGARSAQRP